MRSYAYKGEGKGEGGLKNRSYGTYLLNGWPQTNVLECVLCPGMAKYAKASPPARKVSLFSSIIITIILSYAIIRIYITLHIYLQVSEAERQAELHWVIGQSVLEKINSIYYHGILLAFSRMFFLESECAFKNPNVLNIEASEVTSLH